MPNLSSLASTETNLAKLKKKIKKKTDFFRKFLSEFLKIQCSFKFELAKHVNAKF
jgi:CRISPR/Cas system CSM-associated protein Csm4 (group 5 of RAMP superfamily)